MTRPRIPGCHGGRSIDRFVRDRGRLVGALHSASLQKAQISESLEMTLSPAEQEAETRRWVRYHVIAFFATIGVVVGLLIVDAKIAQIIGENQMPGFRAILLVSVLLAGVGARALLAWRSATVDLQGRIFLTVTGLVLLTGAAFGISDCMQEIREHYKTWQAGRSFAGQTTTPGPRGVRSSHPDRRSRACECGNVVRARTHGRAEADPSV